MTTQNKRIPASRRRAMTVAVVLVVLLNVGYFVYSQTRPPGADIHLRYGEQFPADVLQDLDGRPIDRAGKWALIIMFDFTVGDSLRIAKYGEILHARYADQGLRVIGLTRNTLRAVRMVVRESRLSYPVSIARSDAIAPVDHNQWAYLVDPQGTIRFSTDFLQPNDLRMIVERYLIGEVDYDTKRTLVAIASGDHLPPIKAADLASAASGEDEDPTERIEDVGVIAPKSADAPLVVFSARCSKCSLDSAMASYAVWEMLNLKPGVPTPTLVFSSKFTRDELRVELAKHRLRSPAWHALEPIPGIEDPYSLDGLFPYDLVALTTGPGDKLVRVESWDEYVDRALAMDAAAVVAPGEARP